MSRDPPELTIARRKRGRVDPLVNRQQLSSQADFRICTTPRRMRACILIPISELPLASVSKRGQVQNFHMKMRSFNWQMKLIFISKLLHLTSLWNIYKGQLGKGLLRTHSSTLSDTVGRKPRSNFLDQYLVHVDSNHRMLLTWDNHYSVSSDNSRSQ